MCVAVWPSALRTSSLDEAEGLYPSSGISAGIVLQLLVVSIILFVSVDLFALYSSCKLSHTMVVPFDLPYLLYYFQGSFMLWHVSTPFLFMTE